MLTVPPPIVTPPLKACAPPGTGPVRLSVPAPAVSDDPRSVSGPLRVAVPPLTAVVPVTSYEPAELTVPEAKSTLPAPAMPDVEATANVPPPKAKVAPAEADRTPVPP